MDPKDILDKGGNSSGSNSAVAPVDDIDEKLMAKLCRALEEDLESFDDNAKQQWFETLNEYVGSDHKRLKYAYVSHWIFAKFQQNQFSQKVKDDDIGRILTNLDKLLEHIENTEGFENIGELQGITRKLKDHIDLASYQCLLFAGSIGIFSEQMEARIAEREAKLRAEQKELIATETKELTSQLVGLIAIFTALSFIVFGGITSLESLVQNLSSVQESVLPVVILAIAWSFCLMNLVFGFMYFVLHITKRNFKPAGRQNANLVQKYPVIFIGNYVLFVALLLFGGIWYAERNGVGIELYEFWVKNHSTCTFFLGIIAFVLVVVGLGFLLWKLYKKDLPQTNSDSKA